MGCLLVGIAVLFSQGSPVGWAGLWGAEERGELLLPRIDDSQHLREICSGG